MTSVPGTRDERPSFELVVPAHNEEKYLEACIQGLLPVIRALPVETKITIVDSGSTDDTWQLARSLTTLEGIDAVRVGDPGRGRALRAAWSRSTADYLGYTDVDLSADVEVLPDMLDAVRSGAADIAIGSRLLSGARVDRRLSREFLSRSYGELLQWMAAPPFLDPQCGLKVLRGDRCRELLLEVEDDHWFFDTELLLLAWRSGLEVQEVGIRWTERVRSTVDVPRTICEDLAGLWRVGGAQIRRPVARAPRHPGTAAGSLRLVLGREAQGLLLCVLVTGSPSVQQSRPWFGRLIMILTSVLWWIRTGSFRPKRGVTPMLEMLALTAALVACSTPSRSATLRRRVLSVRVAIALVRLVSVWSWSPSIPPESRR